MTTQTAATRAPWLLYTAKNGIEFGIDGAPDEWGQKTIVAMGITNRADAELIIVLRNKVDIPQTSAWKPMETAPRDRAIIGGGFYKGEFYWDKIQWLNFRQRFQHIPLKNSRYIEPTVWMPAPEHPVALPSLDPHLS